MKRWPCSSFYVALMLLTFVTGVFLPKTLFAQTTITVADSSFDATNMQAFAANGDTTRSGSAVLLVATGSAGSGWGTLFWNKKISLANQRSFNAYFTFSMDTPRSPDPGWCNPATSGAGADGLTFTI